MATLVSEQLRWLADQWENHCGYKSAVLSGIVPDRAHLDTGGYHCSVEDLKAYGNGNDYSNTRPDDRGHNPKHGAGVDMSMSPADMKRCYLRVKRVWDDKSDTRRRYLNAINTWKGSGDATRLDFYANVTSWATPDHKWHNHLEVRRRWLRDWTAVRAIVSVLKGESHAAWLASQKPAAAPTKPKEETMSIGDTTKKDAEKFFRTLLSVDATPAAKPPYHNADYYKADGKTPNNTEWGLRYWMETVVEDVRASRAHAKAGEEQSRQNAKALDALTKLLAGQGSEQIIAAIRAEEEVTREALTSEVRQLAPGLAVAIAAELGPDSSPEQIGEAAARALARMLGDAATHG